MSKFKTQDSRLKMQQHPTSLKFKIKHILSPRDTHKCLVLVNPGPGSGSRSTANQNERVVVFQEILDQKLKEYNQYNEKCRSRLHNFCLRFNLTLNFQTMCTNEITWFFSPFPQFKTNGVLCTSSSKIDCIHLVRDNGIWNWGTNEISYKVYYVKQHYVSVTRSVTSPWNKINHFAKINDLKLKRLGQPNPVAILRVKDDGSPSEIWFYSWMVIVLSVLWALYKIFYMPRDFNVKDQHQQAS